MSYESTVAIGALVCKELDKCKAGTRQKRPIFQSASVCGASHVLVSRCPGDRFSGVLSRHTCFCPFVTRTETLHRGTILRGVLVGGESRVFFSRCFGD